MKYYSSILLCLLGWSIGACAKEIVRDLPANNKVDTLIRYAPKLISNSLPQEVEEQSGMIWYQDQFWVINDSDCKPELIAYDKNGKLQKHVTVENAKNLDWEALAEDEDFFYIGDFGNNHGNRRDLRVLKIAKADMEKENSVKAETIGFSYTDQKNFTRRTHRNNYDCEALFAWGDSLYLFTKNWEDLKTRMYVLSKVPGEYRLKIKDEFEIDFLVTAADISSDGKTIALLGYKSFLSYLTIISGYEGTDFFRGNRIRLDLSALGPCQTEGVVFGEQDQLFISCEASITPQALYQVEWEQWRAFLGH